MKIVWSFFLHENQKFAFRDYNTLCFQQEYLRLPKNLMLTLHDLTKKWPKMTSNDLKSKNYRKKTPTKI